MLTIPYLFLAALAIFAAFYVKNYIGRFLLLLVVMVGMLLLLVSDDYPIYQDLSKNGIETTGIVIAYEKQRYSRRGVEKISHAYTLALDQGQIIGVHLAEPKYQVGTKVQVLYSPQGEGCLLGATKGSPLELAKYALENGRCSRVKKQLEAIH